MPGGQVLLMASSGCELPRQRQALRILPVVSRLRRSTREDPQAHALAIDFEQIGEPTECSVRIGGESGRAVEEMLCRVVGRVAGERLRVDRQPGLAFRSQHVACMQVGCEEDPAFAVRGSS